MQNSPSSTRVFARRALVFVSIAALAMAPFASSLAGAAPQSKAAKLDEALRDAVEKHKIPGLVAVVADTNGVLYRGTAGMRDTEKNAPMTIDSIFPIASMTKPITSVAVMQLVESGRVKLDEPASTYLPELSKLQVLEGFDEAGKPKLRPAKSSPTVRQLLSHTSGFGYEFFNPLLQRYAASGAMPSAARGDDGFLNAPLLFDPGTRFEYGISTDWLGRLVEKISGKDLETYFRDHIFLPLGMNDTFFNVPADKQSRLVPLSTRQGAGFAQVAGPPMTPAKFFSGGGGLFSTAEDYGKFARMLLAGGTLGGKRILRRDTLAQMTRNQIGDIPIAEFRSLIPQFAKDPIRIPGSMTKFGLGFGITTQATPGGRSAGSYAWAGIFSTFFWIDPSRKTCAVLMMHVLPFSDDAAISTVESFERAIYSSARTAAGKSVVSRISG